MIPHLHTVAKKFNIKYLKKEDLSTSTHYLWRVTKMISEINELSDVMTAEK